MNRSMMSKLAIVVFVLTVALSAVAANGSASITVPNNVQLNGKQIAAGDYKVIWTGNDDSLQVTFKELGKTVATGTAKLVTDKEKAPYTSVVQQDGKLIEIRFGGKKAFLSFN